MKPTPPPQMRQYERPAAPPLAAARERLKAFQRTRMAPAVSHERGMDYHSARIPLKTKAPPVSARRSR